MNVTVITVPLSSRSETFFDISNFIKSHIVGPDSGSGKGFSLGVIVKERPGGGDLLLAPI